MRLAQEIRKRLQDELGECDESAMEKARVRHDIKRALHDLSLAVKLLQEGYRFDDEDAPEHVQAVAQAVDELKRFFSEGDGKKLGFFC